MNNSAAPVAVLGAGNMGTALANIIAKNGSRVLLWNHEKEPEPLRAIAKKHENTVYLPGVKLSPRLAASPSLADTLREARVVILAVPSHVVSLMAKRIANELRDGAIIVAISKGVDPTTAKFIPDTLRELLPEHATRIVAMSGPAVAKQMARGVFTVMNINGESDAVKAVRHVLESDRLKLEVCDDVIGMEVGGFAKNVYAIGLGICDGLGIELNTKSVLCVHALREMSDIIAAMGGRRETAFDVAVFGDFVATGFCETSRNRSFGHYLGRGMAVAAAFKKVGQTVEGVRSAVLLHDLAKKHNVSCPFAGFIYETIHAKKKVTKPKFAEFLRKLYERA